MGQITITIITQYISKASFFVGKKSATHSVFHSALIYWCLWTRMFTGTKEISRTNFAEWGDSV